MKITSTHTVSVMADFFRFLRLLKNDSVTNPVALAGYLSFKKNCIIKFKTVIARSGFKLRKNFVYRTDMSFLRIMLMCYVCQQKSQGADEHLYTNV